MLKLLELFKNKIWKSNIDDKNRIELYRNIHTSAKNISRCLDELLYEYKNEELEPKIPTTELIITPAYINKEIEEEKPCE